MRKFIFYYIINILNIIFIIAIYSTIGMSDHFMIVSFQSQIIGIGMIILCTTGHFIARKMYISYSKYLIVTLGSPVNIAAILLIIGLSGVSIHKDIINNHLEFNIIQNIFGNMASILFILLSIIFLSTCIPVITRLITKNYQDKDECILPNQVNINTKVLFYLFCVNSLITLMYSIWILNRLR